MMSRDCGIYEACAINEHGEARQRVNLAVAEYPRFIKRPEETLILARKSAKIEVRISGTPFPEVKWYKDWLPIAESSRIKVCTDQYSIISKLLT
jgi:Immunoglobulin I-set domain